MSDPAARSPRGGSAGPAPPGTAAGGPRDDGDGIAVDIATRAGLVTVQFTGRGHARACPAAGQAFTYRGRQYTGSVFLSGPGWHGSSGLGLSLHPAGGPAGCSVADWGSAGNLHVFCAVLAWSRVRFVRFAGNERSETTLAMLAECFEELGGVPKVVLADRMGCLKGGVVANKVVPTADYVRFAAHYLSGRTGVRQPTPSRNSGLHTAPLRVDAGCCVVVLVVTVAVGSGSSGGFMCRLRGQCGGRGFAG